MKIALISDTHVPQVGPLPSQVLHAFAGSDLILHAGDVYIRKVLDELEFVAPVVAALGNGDLDLEGDRRVEQVQLLKIGGICIGLVHCLTYPQIPLETTFGKVDVVVFGDTHEASIVTQEGVLFVNPGSATVPNLLTGRLGTVGFLEIGGDKPKAWIQQL